jgi:acyl-CoA reductase-like NAD-dependent aldehyde dehydrogenase
MQVRNPRNGKYDYTLTVNTAEEVVSFSKELRSNHKEWSHKPIEERVAVLMQFATALEEHKEVLFEKLSIDTGRRKISRIEIEGALGVIKGRCYSSPSLMNAQQARMSITNPNVEIRQQLVSYSLVGVISPWNFPLLLALIDTIPALLAGCTVLLKPSEVTPRFIDVLEPIIKSIPDLNKVFKVLRGGADTGKPLVDNVDAVCFTGSTNTGLKISERAAQRFIPAFLEMGGKDPAIVLEDADLEVAADAIMRSAAGASGQACQSLERIYIHSSIFDDLVGKLVAKSEACTFNDDYSKGGTIGPLIFEKQADKIVEQIEKAVLQGAKIRCGGKVENINGGLWIAPTVVTDVTHDMDLMTEETFGPIIPCMSFNTDEQAIALANDSKYGLSASVFSKDVKRAIEIASQVSAGGISINDGSLTNQVFDATKNSFKLSGINGSRMGAEGFTRFFRKKAMLIQTIHPASIHTQDEKV